MAGCNNKLLVWLNSYMDLKPLGWLDDWYLALVWICSHLAGWMCITQLLGNSCFQNFHFGRYYNRHIYGQKFNFTAKCKQSLKRAFRSYIRGYNSTNKNFEYGVAIHIKTHFI